mgnify:FL=1
MRENKKYLLIFPALSLLLHYMWLFSSFDNSQNLKSLSQSRLKIRSIRQVGESDGQDIKRAYIKPKKAAPSKSISAKQLAPNFDHFIPEQAPKKDTKGLKPKKAIKALSLSNKNISQFLKGTPNFQSAKQYLNALDKTDSLVKLEVPKGIKEDELNKHELVFYSFQKRTAVSYINSFYKKLNEFKLKNPHLQFPMTGNKEKMVGRVVYDRDGNIVKINMLKWTKTQKLQDFFLDVLKEMTALPNPPKAIIKDNQFTVFFALTVNS